MYQYLVVGAILGGLWLYNRYQKKSSDPSLDPAIPVNTSTAVTEDSVRVGDIVRTGGSASWRARNPGNITFSRWAISAGALTKMMWGIMSFAVFPTDQVGYDAIITLLRNNYMHYTVREAINMYSSGSTVGGNINYVNAVANALGCSPDTVLSTIPNQPERTVANAIVVFEGWTPGTEKRITIS